MSPRRARTAPAARRVCVYCGSSKGRGRQWRQAATEVGRLLAQTGAHLVYGGAKVGLMGAVADAVLAHGGEVIGIIPTVLAGSEIAHAGLPDLRVVETMHERKAMMASLSDAFIALPGGIGTLEELAEILTWAQLGLHGKPVVALDQDGYWRHLLAFLDHAVDQGFLARRWRRRLLVARTPAEAVARAVGG